VLLRPVVQPVLVMAMVSLQIRLPTFPVPVQRALNSFPQLAAADLLTGISPTGASTAWGVNFPAAKIDNNGYFPGSSTAANAADLTSAIGVLGTPSGLYLSLVATAVNVGVTTATTGLKPSEASRIDTKMDDGSPGSGSVVGIGNPGAVAWHLWSGRCGGPLRYCAQLHKNIPRAARRLGQSLTSVVWRNRLLLEAIRRRDLDGAPQAEKSVSQNCPANVELFA